APSNRGTTRKIGTREPAADKRSDQGRVLMMHRFSMPIVLLLGVLSAPPVYAQTPAPAEPPAPTPAPAPETPPAPPPAAATPPATPPTDAKPPPPAVNVLDRAETQGVLGRAVRSKTGEDMGRIVEVIVDRTSGQPRAAIIDFGGFLGIGSRKIAMAWPA